jgi:hypothetical protein
MVDQLTLQTIGILMTGISLTIAAAYYTLTLRNTQKNQQLQLETRQAQLFTQLYSEFRSADNLRLYGKALQMMWDDFDDFEKKYGLEDWEKRVPYTSMSLFYEEIGVLLEEELIDINLVIQLIGGTFRWFWEKFEPIVLEHRVRQRYPQYFDKMEYLYNEIKKLRGHQWEE